MKKALHILMPVVFVVSVVSASAQFSMGTVEKSTELEMPMRVNRMPVVGTDVVNDAKAWAIRKATWRDHNLVDMNITFTGTMTHFNKSWATNNQNSLSGLMVANYYHTYVKNRYTSQFKFDGQYGMNLIDDVWFKNQDVLKLYYLSSWKVANTGLSRLWAYSFSAMFVSQFSEGYKSRTEKQRWSNFLAPGTLTGGLGLTYTSPSKKAPFVVTIEPISGTVLFVMDKGLTDARRQQLGLSPAYAPEDTGKTDPIFKKHKAEGGSNVNISFDRRFVFGKKNGMSLRYRTTLTSFYGWITDVSRRNQGMGLPRIMPTVSWTNTINFDPVKFFTIQFIHTTVYNKAQVDRVQMQYFFSFGLTYGYKNK